LSVARRGYQPRPLPTPQPWWRCPASVGTRPASTGAPTVLTIIFHSKGIRRHG